MKRQGSQLRKSLFYGLTLVLVSVFVYLAVQGNRLEKERKQKTADLVETYDATPIRALNPRDLEITEASMKMVRNSGNEQPPIAKYNIGIHNSGNVSYSSLELELNYLGSGSRVLGSLNQTVEEDIPPGDIRLSIDMEAAGIPTGAVAMKPLIVYADFKPENME